MLLIWINLKRFDTYTERGTELLCCKVIEAWLEQKKIFGWYDLGKNVPKFRKNIDFVLQKHCTYHLIRI